MKRILYVLLALSGTGEAGEVGNLFSSGDLGISMQAPVVARAGPDVYQVAMFFLPAESGFAANVNVQRQRFDGSLDAYRQTSLDQIRQAGWAVVTDSVKGNELRLEYTGSFEQQKLHWYSRAVQVPPYVWLITATAVDSRWDRQKRPLLESVESFRKW